MDLVRKCSTSKSGFLVRGILIPGDVFLTIYCLLLHALAFFTHICYVPSCISHSSYLSGRNVAQLVIFSGSDFYFDSWQLSALVWAVRFAFSLRHVALCRCIL